MGRGGQRRAGGLPAAAVQSAFEPVAELRGALVADLLRDNPWWRGEPGKPLPPTRRDLVGAIHRRLRQGLAPIVVVRGPRQVGKTTAQLQVIEDFLRQGAEPRRIFRVQCDELPELRSLSEPILRLTPETLENEPPAPWPDGERLRPLFDARGPRLATCLPVYRRAADDVRGALR